MSNLPKVSVIIPTYNYGRYITNAIESILKQDYPIDNIEILVADDGSTDDTQVILQPFIDNKTITYFFQHNQGKASSTARSIKRCTGKYIFNLDADDTFFVDKIRKYVAVFEQDDSIVHVGSAASIIYEDRTKKDYVEHIPEDDANKAVDGELMLRRFYANNILYGGGSTYAARKDILDSIDIPFDSDMYIDEFLIIAVLRLGKSYIFSQPLSVWNVHGNNYSANAKSQEQLVAKSERYIKSSKAIYDYTQEHAFDKHTKSVYKLIHYNRIIAFKEGVGKKTIKDITAFAKIILRSGLEISVLRKYSVFNRLLPTWLIRIIKK